MFTMRSTRLFLITTISFLTLFQSVVAQEKQVSGSQKLSITVGQSNSTSLGSLFEDPSNSGLSGQSVNLYTGQHVESFPLASLSGRGGLGVSISLDYEGNVAKLAKLENRLGQASPYGLGFNLGSESIVVDHNSTTDIWDDEYKLRINNTSMDLNLLPNGNYMTVAANPWIISRKIDTVSGREMVVGWTIKKEDGTIYRYGDFLDSSQYWNATRSILRYGDYVGFGVTADDSAYPVQWDLKIIQDIDSLNWLTFTYFQDSAYLVVRDTNGTDTTSSANPYTRASYIDAIETSDGYKVEFLYSSRDDLQDFYGLNHYEFFYERKLDEIRTKSRSDEIIERIRFKFDYLSPQKDSTFQKLLLKSITRLTPSGADSLLPIRFEYDTSATNSVSFGSIKKIFYPSGGVKELAYSTVDSADNYTQLDYKYIDSLKFAKARVKVSENMFIHWDTVGSSYTGYWNGFWTIDTFSIGDYHADINAITPNGWGVLYDSTIDKFIVKKWEFGAMRTDTIPDAITRFGSVFIYPGKNCFVAVTGNDGGCGVSYRPCVRRVYYYRWRNGSWKSFLITTFPSQYALWGVKVLNDVFAFSAQKDGYSYFYYSKYDHKSDLVFTSNTGAIGPSYSLTANRFSIGTNTASLLFNHGFDMFRWNYDSTAWIRIADINLGASSDASHVSSHPNGLTWTYHMIGGPTRSMQSRFFKSSFDELELIADTLDDEVYKMWASGNSIALMSQINKNLNLFRWNGTKWQYDHLIEPSVDDYDQKELYLYADGYAWGPGPSFFPDTLELGRYLGNQTWYDELLVLNTVPGPTHSTEKFSIFKVGYEDKLYLFHPFYFGQTYKNFVVSDHTGRACVGSMDSDTYGAGDNFVVLNRFDGTCDYYDATAFKIQDTLFKGKARLVVVDSVMIYRYDGAADPTIVKYEYFGGLIDETATTPRFARVKISTPYYASDGGPDGYSVHYFYNDIDDNKFYDTSIFQQDSLVKVDLEDASLFGVKNGGYRLDGTEYLSYTYTVGDTAGQLQDTTRNYHSVFKIPDSASYGLKETISVSSTASIGLIKDTAAITDSGYVTYRVSINNSSGSNATYAKVYKNGNLVVPYVAGCNTCNDSGSFVVGPNDTVVTWAYVHTPDTEGSSKSVAFIHKDVGEYRILLDSTHTRIEGLARDVQYSYYPEHGQLRSTKSRQESTSTYIVDSVIYAYQLYGNQSMTNDNAITQVAKNIRILDVNGDTTIQSIAGTDYGKHGSWKPHRTYTWRDYSDFSDTLFTTNILPSGSSFDQYGNRLATVNVSGDTSNVKYDSAGVNIVAAAVNCSPYDFLIQDFEQGDGWDSWDTKTWKPYINLITGDSVFTGNYSYRLDDDTSGAYRSWGADRWIPASSLTTDKYYFSCWLKSNHVVRIYNWCLGSDSSTCTNGYKFFEFTNLDSINWQRVEGVFDLSDVDTNCLAWIKPELVLNDGPNGTEFAEFDDFRFHPLDAKISTTTFDKKSTQILSRSGVNNVPVKYIYDRFQRAKALFDHNDKILSKSNYYNSSPTQAQNLNVSLYDNDFGIRSQSDTLSTDQFVFYSLKAKKCSLDCSGFANVKKNGIIQAQINCTGGCDSTKTGSFYAWEGDNIETNVFTDASEIGDTLESRIDYETVYITAYDTLKPDYVKTTSYSSDIDSSIIITFSDGVGRLLQTRTTDPRSGQDKAIVSGIAEYDSRGRALKSYKTYQDLIGQTGVEDYSHFDTALTEIFHFYSDSSLGPDCEGFPYSESVFDSNFKSRLLETTSSGIIYSLDSPYTSTVSYETDTINDLRRTISYDQDGIKSVSEADHWGLYSKGFSYYKRGAIDDSLSTISSSNYKGQLLKVEIDTGGASPIKLREYFYNDMGRKDSTWKVDYGTIRMLYDKAGRTRFMQNDKRANENRFVYFKYDKLGRRIEEGRMDSATTYFSQTYADSDEFPDTTVSPVVRYKWYYDSYDSIVAPGQLVRVESGDLTYYREFHTYAGEDSDLVVVELPTTGDSKKAIKHEYMRDGTLEFLTVYPKYPALTGMRKMQYFYNDAGQLRAIRYIGVLLDLDSLYYAEYEYNAEGAIQTAAYGITYSTSGVDTVQKIDYRYNALGALDAINLPSDVVSIDSLGVESGNDNDHFGMEMIYIDPPDGYANGRLLGNLSANSLDGDKKSHEYYYQYNDLGWLTGAEDSLDATNNRYYTYDALGNRDTVFFGSDTITYDFYGTNPGTSLLARTSDMPAGDSFYYDVLGNLIADTAGKQYSMTYYENNLLWGVSLEPNLGPSEPNTTLGFFYNENEQRIMKKYLYYVWEECGGPPPLGPMGPGGPGGDSCAAARYTYTTYLYDNGVLLATFDGSDNVIDMFVNGPEGKIASFSQNNFNQLYYYFGDHLGSTRLTMIGGTDTTVAKVTGWYNYHPFGDLIASSETYSTPFRFTSKQLDDESTFGQYYFGSRYYNPKLGRFGTIDKAGQFTSGFVYGGNNPTLGTDPDGNLFFLGTPFLMAMLNGAAFSGGFYTTMYGLEALRGNSGQDFLGGLGGSVAAGAISGGITFGVGKIPGSSPAFGAAKGAAGGILGGGLGNLATGGNFFDNAGYSAVSGAISGYADAAYAKVRNAPGFGIGLTVKPNSGGIGFQATFNASEGWSLSKHVAVRIGAAEEVARLTKNWVTGSGKAEETFGPGHPMTQLLRGSRGVRIALQKLKSFIGPLQNNTFQWHTDFEVLEVVSATFTLNPAEHFIGSYGVEIQILDQARVKITVTNSTSMSSATRYIQYKYPGVSPLPSYQRTANYAAPGSTIIQYYTWIQEY